MGERYIPALRFRGLTRFYDPLLAVVLREQRWKTLLVDAAAPRPGMDLLDLGCGTGTLTVALAKAAPGASIVGLDADAEVLAGARAKAAAAGVRVDFVVGRAEDPPFADESFDRIVSSLLFHHLTRDSKLHALTAARRLLRNGGELHLADWGRPGNALMRAASLPVQLLDGFATTRDNIRGLLPDFLREAGFDHVAETDRQPTVFGTLTILRAA